MLDAGIPPRSEHLTLTKCICLNTDAFSPKLFTCRCEMAELGHFTSKTFKNVHTVALRQKCESDVHGQN